MKILFTITFLLTYLVLFAGGNFYPDNKAYFMERNSHNGTIFTPSVSNVRIQEEYGLDGKIIRNLSLGEKLVLLGETWNEIVINGDKGIWYRLRTEKGEKGWVFSAYLKELSPGENKENDGDMILFSSDILGLEFYYPKKCGNITGVIYKYINPRPEGRIYYEPSYIYGFYGESKEFTISGQGFSPDFSLFETIIKAKEVRIDKWLNEFGLKKSNESCEVESKVINDRLATSLTLKKFDSNFGPSMVVDGLDVIIDLHGNNYIAYLKMGFGFGRLPQVSSIRDEFIGPNEIKLKDHNKKDVAVEYNQKVIELKQKILEKNTGNAEFDDFLRGIDKMVDSIRLK